MMQRVSKTEQKLYVSPLSCKKKAFTNMFATLLARVTVRRKMALQWTLLFTCICFKGMYLCIHVYI